MINNANLSIEQTSALNNLLAYLSASTVELDTHYCANNTAHTVPITAANKMIDNTTQSKYPDAESFIEDLHEVICAETGFCTNGISVHEDDIQEIMNGVGWVF